MASDRPHGLRIGCNMKLVHATYFAEATAKVLSTVCGLKVKSSAPRVLSEGSPTSDVTGIITFSGDVVGAVLTSFPADVAQRIVKAFAAVDGDIHDPAFLDAIGELTNMIAGQAKSRYEGYSASISIPTVICGQAHHVNRQQRAPWVVIANESEWGSFLVAMALSEKPR